MALLLQIGDLLQHRFQTARLFTGRNQVAVQRIEIARLPAQGIGQSAACADISFQRAKQGGQRRIAAALGNHLKRLHQRHARADQTRQLAAELAQLASAQRTLSAPEPRVCPLDPARANTALA
ncbi:hypothetical protein D3C80_966630 [compost metagenome]